MTTVTGRPIICSHPELDTGHSQSVAHEQFAKLEPCDGTVAPSQSGKRLILADHPEFRNLNSLITCGAVHRRFLDHCSGVVSKTFSRATVYTRPRYAHGAPQATALLCDTTALLDDVLSQTCIRRAGVRAARRERGTPLRARRAAARHSDSPPEPRGGHALRVCAAPVGRAGIRRSEELRRLFTRWRRACRAGSADAGRERAVSGRGTQLALFP